MTLNELTDFQKLQLKQQILFDWYANDPDETEFPSIGELFEADSIVSDEDLFKEFGNTDFSEDDFSKEDDFHRFNKRTKVKISLRTRK